MPRPRLQFRLSTLLWITLAVACWFGGLHYRKWIVERGWSDVEAETRHPLLQGTPSGSWRQLRDGRWLLVVEDETMTEHRARRAQDEEEKKKLYDLYERNARRGKHATDRASPPTD
jgi:hypothetical protein